ncbi:unnamed protein product [Alopecurus aequalis]
MAWSSEPISTSRPFNVVVRITSGVHMLDVSDSAGRSPLTGLKWHEGYNEEQCLSWVQGDAEALSFEDGSMDGYTTAFGIRNVTHIEKALSYRWVI